MPTRYATTILSNGTRIFTGANQGHYFFDTMEEAEQQAAAKRLPQNRDTYEQVFGPGSFETIEARAVECHESGDAIAHYQPLSWNDLIRNVKTAAAKGQWTAVSEKMYDYMLECVPPAGMQGYRFLCGEPWSHTNDGQALYYSFVYMRPGHFYATIETLQDWKDCIKQFSYNHVFSFHC